MLPPLGSPVARQLLRDERAPRIQRINALGQEIARCLAAKAFDATLVMQFIELDTWAFLTRPERSRHGRTSFIRFVDRFLQSDPAQAYRYRGLDVYAARCALLHTFGSMADLHDDPSVVIWRFHLGTEHTFVPGLTRMAYISVKRFLDDCHVATDKCLAEVRSDDALGELFGNRLPRVYFLAGVLPSRDPDAVAAMDPEIDAEILKLDRASGHVAG